MQSPPRFPKDSIPDPVARSVNVAWQVTRDRLERERREADPLTKLRMQINFLSQAIQTILAEIDRLDEEVDAGEFSHYRHTETLTELERRIAHLEIRVDGEAAA